MLRITWTQGFAVHACAAPSWCWSDACTPLHECLFCCMCAHVLCPSLLQVRLIAAMLSPLLEAVVGNPQLADPVTAAGAAHSLYPVSPGSTSASPVPGGGVSPRPGVSSSGPSAGASSGGSATAAAGLGQAPRSLGPVAAAAAALLQLRLLEVFFFLPAAQLWGNCHDQLLQLCCRQLLGVGGSRIAPGKACHGGLRGAAHNALPAGLWVVGGVAPSWRNTCGRST